MPDDKVRVSSLPRNPEGTAFECQWQKNDQGLGNPVKWKNVYTSKFLVTGINKGHFNRITVIRGAINYQNGVLELADDFEIVFNKE